MIWFLIFVLSVGSWFIQFAMMVGEGVDYANVRGARYIPFSTILYKDEQRRNIVVPAIAALASGAFMSLAASFLFDALTEKGNRELYAYLGILSLLLGAAILLIILAVALKGSGDASELARDPLSIRSAADAFGVSEVRGSVDPDTLDANVREWRRNIVSHSMSVRSKRTSRMLEYRLYRASREPRSFRMWAYCSVYFTAIVVYPLSFILFYFNVIASILGAIAFIITVSGSDSVSTGNGEPMPLGISIIIGCIGLFVNVLTMLFYSSFRGGRAVRWHSNYVQELMAAHSSIREAKSERGSRVTDRQILEKLDIKLDSMVQNLKLANFRLK